MVTIYKDGEYFCAETEREILKVIANVKIETENDKRDFEEILADLETQDIECLIEEYKEDLYLAFEDLADEQNCVYEEDNYRRSQPTWER